MVCLCLWAAMINCVVGAAIWDVLWALNMFIICRVQVVCVFVREVGGNVFISAKNVYVQRFFMVWFVGKRLHKFCKKCPIPKCMEYYCGNILNDRFSIVQRSWMKTSPFNWREIGGMDLWAERCSKKSLFLWFFNNGHTKLQLCKNFFLQTGKQEGSIAGGG
jgi:hypothetical protein